MATIPNTDIKNLAEVWNRRYIDSIRNRSYSEYFTTRQYEDPGAIVVHRKVVSTPISMADNVVGGSFGGKRAVDGKETMVIDKGKTASFKAHPVESKSEARGNPEIYLKRVNDAVDTLASYTDNDHIKKKIDDSVPAPDHEQDWDFNFTGKSVDDRRIGFHNF